MRLCLTHCRLGADKGTAYEEDLLVPFYIAGPGIAPQARTSAAMANMVRQCLFTPACRLL